MHEFEIIEQFFTRPVKNRAQFPLGVGDDAALIAPPPGCELATSIDTLNVNVHFPSQSDAYDIGYKSLAVSLSDLAAMGAQAAAVLLAITLPEAKTKWLTEFAAGFFGLADQYQVDLIGGNVTRGPLSISTVTFGWVPAGHALRRSGAKVGDDIYVTGTLGDAGLALKYLLQKIDRLDPELHQRFFRPHPRLNAGLALRDIASAAIDISDGLAADLGKLLHASQVGGNIQITRLPLSAVLQSQCPGETALQLALTAGEDYELCFTAPPTAKTQIEAAFAHLECPAHCIGQVDTEPGLRIYAADGKQISIAHPGFQHF